MAGRREEHARLAAALREAAAGRGSAFLIGGESGIGKSRLVEEVAGLGLVFGLQVVRGQQPSEGAAPYRLWRDVVRALVLGGTPSDAEAGVLLPVAPELPSLIGRRVPAPAELDAPSQQARIVEVIEHLLQRQRTPTVLVLEDLQWAGAESLAVVKAVARLARNRALVVLATFRSDERPDLATVLGDLTHVELARLPATALADAAAAMLGEAGRNDAVVALLARETEGNPFFLVEVVRALAEEAGTLDGIAATALPERVLAGGILQVVERRLSRVPAAARPVLRFAAVAGRRIDAALVRAAWPEAPASWMAACIEAGILERHEGEVRFAHDKLREGVLLELSPDERQRLHRRAAEALERLRPDAPEYAAALAHHWGQAGDDAREGRYASAAGTQALASGALAEGIRLLGRALALAEQKGAPAEERARLHRQLGDACFDLGDFGRADEHLASALALLGHRLPRSRPGWILSVLRAVAGRTLRRLLGRSRGTDAGQLEASRAAGRLALMRAYQFRGVEVLALSLLAVSLGERSGRDNVFALGVLGHGASMVGMPGLAEDYFRRGRETAQRLDDQHGVAELVVMEGNLLLGRGRLAESVRLLEEELPTVHAIRDRVAEATLGGTIGMCLCLLGRFDDAADCFRRVLVQMEGHSEQHRHNYVVALVRALVCAGRLDEAWQVAQPLAGRFAPEAIHSRASYAGTLARLHVGRGDVPAAVRAADEAMALCPRVSDVPSICGFVLEGAADAYLAAWREAIARGEPAQAARRARRMVATLTTWSYLYRIGKPMAALYRGRFLALAGKARPAQRQLARAAALARELGMAWHEGTAQLELAAIQTAAAEGALAGRDTR
jgi:tetratricopeptide (TPR) repeat protein